MRLIDADALRIAIDKLEAESDMPKMWHNGLAYAVNRIVHAPTVDAVPVVRCKDCKYYEETGSGGIGTCLLTISGAEVDGFCAWGERREDG